MRARFGECESSLSIDAATRIIKLAAEMKSTIKRYFVLLNSVNHEHTEAMKQKIEQLHMEYLGEIPADEAVRDSILRGGLLHDLAEDSIILVP